MAPSGPTMLPWRFLLHFVSCLQFLPAALSCNQWSPGEPAAEWACHSSHKDSHDCSDTAHDTLGIMADDNQKIMYEGTLAAWDFYAHVPGKTSLQIWRQGATTTGFKLVCVTEATADTEGLHHVGVAPGTPPCVVKQGDFFGMWQEGAGVVGVRWSNYPSVKAKNLPLAVISQVSGVKTEPKVPQEFTVRKIGAPRSYAITITICGGDWGTTVLVVLATGLLVYVGGGVAYGRFLGGRSGRGGILESHPHHVLWVGVAALVHDGVQYSRQQTTRRGGGVGGGSGVTQRLNSGGGGSGDSSSSRGSSRDHSGGGKKKKSSSR